MEATVKLLRTQGRRKPQDAVNAEPGTRGTVVLAEGGNQLRLASADGARIEPLLPVLHEARLVMLHNGTMLFRGVERGADGTEYVQEWSARVRLASRQGELFVAEDGPG
jgi:hypothetical protein